ncbi:MAG: hypothetical protein AB1938_16155 [Myxococcota bacterium]
MKPSGKVNPVSVLVMLALAGATYWAVLFIPLYYDNLEVKEALDSAFSQARVEGEETARVWLMRRLNGVTPNMGTLGSHYEVDEDGVEQLLPGLGVPEENVTFTWDEAASTLTLRVEYERVVILKPSEKRKVLHFVVEKKGSTK